MQGSLQARRQGWEPVNITGDTQTLTDHPEVPVTGTVWAPVKYNWKEPVEAKSASGAWIKCKVEGAGVYYGYFHLRCAQNALPPHGEETFLPNVPFKLIRRVLDVGDKDYVLMNRGGWPGKGIRYRYSMDMNDAGGEIAPWGMVVVGEDVDPDWIKTDRGYYLPKRVDDEEVLDEQPRTDAVWSQADLSTAVFADMRKKQKDFEDHQFEAGEHALYKTKRGEWIKCRIAAREKYGLYAIIAMPLDYAMYPVGGVFPDKLKKIDHVEHHVSTGNESKLCKRDGCVTIMANTSSVISNRALLVDVPKKSNLKLLMTMVCQKVMKEFKTCVNETQFRFNGQLLDPMTRMEDSGLDDQSVVQVKTAAEVQAELDRATELEKQRKARQEAKTQLETLRKAAAKHPNNRNVQEAVKRAQTNSKAAKVLASGKKPVQKKPLPAHKPKQSPAKKPVQAPPKKPAQAPHKTA